MSTVRRKRFKSEEERIAFELAVRSIRALASVALEGDKIALEELRRSKEELKEEWYWIPEVRELFERGLL